MTSFGKYLIFPEHTLEAAPGGGQSDIRVIETDGDERRSRRSTKRRRRITIAGMNLTQSQHEQFQTFCDLVEDELEPFLFRDIRRCRIVNEPMAPVAGDNTGKLWRLQMSRTEQGRTKVTTITTPDHDYPARFWTPPNSDKPRQYWPRVGNDGLVHVFVNGVEVAFDTSTPTLLDDLRYRGQVKLVNAPANGMIPTASCYFYHLMRFEGGSPQTKASGGGAWKVEGGVTMIEPKGLEPKGGQQ